MWNRIAWTGFPWLERYEALTQPHRDAAGDYPAEDWQAAIRASGRFGALESAEVEHVHRTTGAGLTDLVASWSWIANLPDAERAELLRGVGELVDPGARLMLPYRTEIHWAPLV
jgi:hypothetical protein